MDHIQKNMDSRFDSMEERFDSLEKRMDKQEQRTDKVEQTLLTHIEKYNSDQDLIQSALFKLESSFKSILDKQIEYDMAFYRLQLQMDNQ
jgi:uncharacterized coiled-coil protein SlyX